MDDDSSDVNLKLLGQGVQRICTPQQTLDRVLPLRQAFGITRLANVTGLDRLGLPVVLAIRPNARSIAVSQGKGATLAHAKASALMEAVEIWHAERFEKPVYFASVADLSRDHAFVDLDRLPRTNGRPPSRTERLHWVEALDIMQDREVLVPLEMVHADYTHPLPPGAGAFPASTNGLASGNHRLEAICHAICEVIERDALSVWHHRPKAAQQATRLDLGSIDDPVSLEALHKFAAAGLDCAVWNVTSDVAVATFMCIIREGHAESNHLGLGSGTHPDRSVALQRALNEAAQTRLNYISGAREDLSFDEYASAGRADKAAGLAFDPGEPGSGQRFGDMPTTVHADLESDLAWLKQRLRASGIHEIAVVDLTRAEFGIPVVRVILPGLEAPHDDASYVAGARALAVAGKEQVR